MPQSLFPSQAVKTGLCLSFYHRKGRWSQDQQTSFAFCAELPREGRGAIHHHCSPCILPAQSSSSTICLVTWDAGSQCWGTRSVSLPPVPPDTGWTWAMRHSSILCATCPVLLAASPQSSRLLFLSETNAPINLQTLLLDRSNILFKIIIWKITWQRTLLLFLLWKGARFAEGPQAGLW